MSEINDRISGLKSQQNLLDKRYGEGSTEKLIELLKSYSSLLDEKRKILSNRDLCKDEKIERLSDVRRRIMEFKRSYGLRY